MLRVGINGVGRIGRAIIRRNQQIGALKVVAINDINPDIKNIAYTLNYDTVYGRLDNLYKVEGDHLRRDDEMIKVFCRSSILDVPWEESDVDVVIDASGIKANVLQGEGVLKKSKLSHVFITHSPSEGVDFTLVLGANEQHFDLNAHRIIASSICDATALAPVLKILHENFGIDKGSVTTLHPWLSYQNIMDGPASSWSVPGEIYHHYALGRSAIGNMIPKPTSAINATCRVLTGLKEESLASFSYRTPTAIVGSADLTLMLTKDTNRKDLIELFSSYEQNQKWNIIRNNLEPLVSLDFVGSDFSTVVDHRWTDVIGNNLVKLVLWYDNEWGYASRVIDQVKFVAHMKGKE